MNASKFKALAIFGGGVSLFTEHRKEGKRRELLALAETSERGSEA